MFVCRSGRNEQYLQNSFHRCFLLSCSSFGQTVSEEQNLKNQEFRSKNSLWRPWLLTDRDEIHRCLLPNFRSFGQEVSEETIFRNRPIRHNNYLWHPPLLMDLDEMSNLYIGYSIDAFYQVSVDLAKQFQRR